MMKLMDFSNDKLEQALPFIPTYPNGEEMDAKIYLRSLKSTPVQKEIDRITKVRNQTKKSVDQVVQDDIDIICATIDSISGFTVSDEDNVFGFETENEQVLSNPKNIRLLIEKFFFLRQQIAAQVHDDNFFYLSTNSVKDQQPV